MPSVGMSCALGGEEAAGCRAGCDKRRCAGEGGLCRGVCRDQPYFSSLMI